MAITQRPLTAAQSRSIDALAMQRQGVDGLTLMEHASRGCCDVIRTWLAARGLLRVLILAGGGNNGGDGLTIARLLSTAVDVRVVLLSDPARLRNDALVNWRRLVAETRVPIDVRPQPPTAIDQRRVAAASLVVDAILGTGYSPEKPLKPHVAAWLDAVRMAARAAIAIDVPSGLDASTGNADPHTLRCDATCTFVGPKVGLLSGDGSRLAGRVHVVDIGVSSTVIDEAVAP